MHSKFLARKRILLTRDNLILNVKANGKMVKKAGKIKSM